MKKTLIYVAGSGSETPVEVQIKAIDIDDIPHNKMKTLRWCKSCGAYGRGGCNPIAPDFANLKKGYKMAIVVSVRVFYKDRDKYESAKITHFMKTTHVDRLLANLCVKLGSVVSREALPKPNFFLATGFCKGCNSCKFPETGVCINPEKRTFSLESTGILVTKLVPQVFGYDLQWYRKDEAKQGINTEYLSKTFAVLLPEAAGEVYLETLTFNAIKGVFTKKKERGII